MDDQISSPIRPAYIDEPMDVRFVVVSAEKIESIKDKCNTNTKKTTESHIRTWEAWLKSLPEGIYS